MSLAQSCITSWKLKLRLPKVEGFQPEALHNLNLGLGGELDLRPG